MDLLLVLGIPLLGALLLALLGARRCAAELNVGVSLATLSPPRCWRCVSSDDGPMLLVRTSSSSSIRSTCSWSR